jgi:hypothetical protein
VQAHLDGYPVWYVRDLPANGGDFEWTEDPAAAKLLGWFWQVRFLAFCRRDTNRPNYGCLPVYRYEEAGKYQRMYPAVGIHVNGAIDSNDTVQAPKRTREEAAKMVLRS